MRTVLLGLGLVGMSAMAACYEAPPMSVDGNMTVRGEQLGEWNLDPGLCAGGFYYKGVDVSSLDGERCMRFVDDPEVGPAIVVFEPGTLNGHLFTENDCDTFHVRLDRVVDQKDRLYNHGGEIELSCATEDSFVEGHIEFDGCW